MFSSTAAVFNTFILSVWFIIQTNARALSFYDFFFPQVNSANYFVAEIQKNEMDSSINFRYFICSIVYMFYILFIVYNVCMSSHKEICRTFHIIKTLSIGDTIPT